VRRVCDDVTVTDGVNTDTYVVDLEVEAIPEEVAAVQAVFDEVGFPVYVSANILRHGADPLPWIISIGTAVGVVLNFFNGTVETFLKPTAEQEGKRFSDWIDRLHTARRDKPGAIVIDHSDENPEVLLERGLPPEAFEQLWDLYDRKAFDEIEGEFFQIRYKDGVWWRPW
jgi:hypothetical protein